MKEQYEKILGIVKKQPKYIVAGVAIVLGIVSGITFFNSSSKELVNVTVYDSKELYIEPTGKSDVQFEVGMYDNNNLYGFSDFPIKLRVDNTSTIDEAVEIGEQITEEIKNAIDEHFKGTDYSVKTYVYHTRFDESGNSDSSTSKELTTIITGGENPNDERYK